MFFSETRINDELHHLHLHLSTSCHVAHKASTQLRQPALSAAAICTSLQFFHPAFSLSLSAVLLHVVLGLSRFRRPSGVQVNAVLQSLFGSFLMMWPMNFYLRLRTPSLRFFISAIFRTSLFVILSCQHILNIRLRHLLWKTLSCITLVKILVHFRNLTPFEFLVISSTLCSWIQLISSALFSPSLSEFLVLQNFHQGRVVQSPIKLILD